jgi:uncharacterized protein
MPAKPRRVPLDALKPDDPSIVEMSQRLAELEGMDGVHISIYEVDRKVENANITIERSDLDFEIMVANVKDAGGTIHSVEEAVAGEEMIPPSPTLQDKG